MAHYGGAVVGVDVEGGVPLDCGGEITHGLLQLVVAPVHLLHFVSVSSALLFHLLKQVVVGLNQRSEVQTHMHRSTS